MSNTFDTLAASNIKREVEGEIAKLLQSFQDRTGLTVTGVSHVITQQLAPGPAKILSAKLHVELQ